MDTKQLLRYLKNILGLEQECRTLRWSINKLVRRANSLGIKNKYKEPGTYSFWDCIEWGDIFTSLLLGGVLGGLSFLVLRSTWGYRDELIPIVLIAIFLPIFIVFTICPLAVTSSQIIGAKKYKKKLEGDKILYAANIIADQARVEKELGVKAELTANINSLKSQLAAAEENLEKLYSLDVIYGKYRDMVAISMFVQYLESGRCEELKGPNGCYNLYESELRQNMIIGKLSEISDKLDAIQANQYELYQTITQSNNKILALCDASLSEQQRHNRISEYNQERSISTQRAIGEYAIMRDLISQ
ncbi:MAG: hypothetical protein IJO54_05655 [Oscillospiraceae bacterium]|nr:hypothetical protein [Oscillospiraceae bacterium]